MSKESKVEEIKAAISYEKVAWNKDRKKVDQAVADEQYKLKAIPAYCPSLAE